MGDHVLEYVTNLRQGRNHNSLCDCLFFSAQQLALSAILTQTFMLVSVTPSGRVARVCVYHSTMQESQCSIVRLVDTRLVI